MARKKIAVVGAGNVGATTALLLQEKALGDIVLHDVAEGIPQGKALDLMEKTPIDGTDVKVTGTNSFDDIKGVDMVIVTAGMARKPGMSREDLLAKNKEIMTNVATNLKRVAPDAFTIVVSNPLDIMVYLCNKIMQPKSNKIMGMAGVLDTIRFRTFVAMELNVSVESVHGLVLGGHGDDMVPLIRYCFVGGIPLAQLLSKERIDAIVERTRKGGGEIVALLKTGSAFYAPAAAVVKMAESILLDKKMILPCAAYLKGEYGEDGIFVGVPAILGASGVEKVVELELSDEEKAMFKKSASRVREYIKEV
jgi:malate dehydrogenase